MINSFSFVQAMPRIIQKIRMILCFLRYFLLFSCPFGVVMANDAPNKLTVATEVWEPGYTAPDGSGLYEAILRRIYPGYQIEFIYTDYMRSKALVKKMQVDMWLGAYHQEEPYALFPDTPMDFDEVVALYKKSPGTKPQPPPFDGARMVWLTGYKYDLYFDGRNIQGVEVRDIATAVRLLNHEKVTFILGDETELAEGLAALDINIQQFQQVVFGNLGLFPAFSKTVRSRQLIARWEQTLNTMIANGELQRIYQQHQLGEEYLFD